MHCCSHILALPLLAPLGQNWHWTIISGLKWREHWYSNWQSALSLTFGSRGKVLSCRLDRSRWRLTEAIPPQAQQTWRTAPLYQLTLLLLRKHCLGQLFSVSSAAPAAVIPSLEQVKYEPILKICTKGITVICRKALILTDTDTGTSHHCGRPCVVW